MKYPNFARLFRYMWRINSIAIFALTTILIIAFIREQIKESRRSTESRSIPRADVVTQEPGKPELELSVFIQVGKTPILTSDLVEARGYVFTKKGNSGAIHNVLFLDTSTGQSRWLLPDSKSTVESDTPINIPNDPANNYLARIYSVRSVDNKTSLLLINPIGTTKRVIASGNVYLDSALAHSTIEGTIVYHDSNNHYIQKLNFSDFSTQSTSKIKLDIPSAQ